MLHNFCPKSCVNGQNHRGNVVRYHVVIFDLCKADWGADAPPQENSHAPHTDDAMQHQEQFSLYTNVSLRAMVLPPPTFVPKVVGGKTNIVSKRGP